MVICKCCKIEYPDTELKCNICGMPRLSGPDVKGQDIAGIIAKTKTKYLGNTQIYLKKYTYEISNGTVDEPHQEKILLAEPIKMEVGETEWLDEEFEVIHVDREITIDLAIKKDSKTKELQISLRKPKEGFRKIGIKITPGFRFRIVAGDEKDHKESEENSVI